MTFLPTSKYSDGLNYHFLFLNSFTFDSTTKNEVEILNDFIRTDFFLDDFHFDMKEKKSSKTHGPFDVEELKTSDFKVFTPGQLRDLMDRLAKEDDWGDDLEDFKNSGLNQFQQSTL